ncbi:MAG: GGDEF domain-containing protein, partial [Eubacterium sp.]
RYGGDEFVCLCQNMSTHEVEVYVQTLRSTLAQKALKHKSSRCSDYVTVSIGLSTNEYAPDKDTATLLEEADQALYASKTSGRNAYTIWHEKKS